MDAFTEVSEMRRRAGLKEQSRQWPPVMSASDVEEYVEKTHQAVEDLDEGDLRERIHSHFRYYLTELPTESIDQEQWAIDPVLLHDYMNAIKGGSIPPPIVIQELGNVIIDGTHRHEALAKMGIPTIMAYVGRKADIVPDHENPYSGYDDDDDDDDDDEWHPSDPY